MAKQNKLVAQHKLAAIQFFQEKPVGIYIHWPFCLKKCPYCDYNSHVRKSVEIEQWQNAFLQEIRYYAQCLGRRTVASIFFGGGTPSLMPVALVEAILQEIQRHFIIAENAEITLEANPTSIEAQRFSGYYQAGVNRISVGVQALNDSALQFLGRDHSVKQALTAIEIAAAIFPRWSFDLIYARPQQSVAAWQQELEQALSFGSAHLSLYQLSIEESTAFYRMAQRGEIILPSEEVAATMYAVTAEMCAKKGLEQYEISSYAVVGQECQHNLGYWRYNDYIGIGAGAHGRITFAEGKTALQNYRQPETWLAAVLEKGNGLEEKNLLTQQQKIEEMVFLTLRNKQGIPADAFYSIAGVMPVVYFAQALPLLLEQQCILQQKDTIVLTDKGRLYANAVERELLRL